MHLILFDGHCAICNLAVRHIVAIDKKKLFYFAPLESEAARTILDKDYGLILEANTIVLIEDFKKRRKIWLRSRAILRIYWIAGRGWKLLGIFSFLPGQAGDLLYRLFSMNRYQFKKTASPGLQVDKERLLK